MLPDNEIRNRLPDAGSGRLNRPRTQQPAPEGELATAFAAFSNAAGSLQNSYALLQAEVARIREELAGKDRELEKERAEKARLQLLGEVAGELAHEVRNPLASLELFAELAASAEELSAETREWMQQMQSGLRILSATVNNVLHSQHLPESDMWPLDSGDVVHSFARFLRPVAWQNRVSIVVEEGSASAGVIGDPNRLHQVLLNIGLNAIRSMPKGGTLRVNCVCRDGHVEISLEDNGQGIAPENLRRIFEPGFSTRPGSSGLGLSVSRKIMEQHGGAITVNSVPGQGAKFTLRLRAA